MIFLTHGENSFKMEYLKEKETTMTKQNIFIDDIYWERVQLFVKGHFEGVKPTRNFLLRNLTETKLLNANHVNIQGSTFEARFNIAILEKVIFRYRQLYINQPTRR